MNVNNLSSNWKKLQASHGEKSNATKLPRSTRSVRSSHQNELKRKKPSSHLEPATVILRDGGLNSSKARKRPRLSSKMSNEIVVSASHCVTDSPKLVQRTIITNVDRTDRINGGLHTEVELGKYLALDCEMVGVGPPPHLESALARISIVNYNGDCVYDSYVKPLELVTDWRTHVSGIAPKHMVHARAFEEVQNDVAALIKDRILVGHSIRGDFEALLLSHPMKDVRDTARHPPYRKLAGGGSPKLKILASELLGLDIQAGEHSSIEDARATMLLFRRDKDAFEREHAKKWPARAVPVKENQEDEQTRKPKKKKKKKRR